MSKLLEATCTAGVVTAESVPVPAADVLSEGNGPSSGVLLIDGEKAKYITSSASDVKALITNIVALVDALVVVATAHDALLGSTQTANLAAVTVLRTSLDASKELLK